jgi:hypothetical protein
MRLFSSSFKPAWLLGLSQFHAIPKAPPGVQKSNSGGG